MKYTLLELTQRLLSSIKGEEVDSIFDTAESSTIVDIIKECYFNIISNQDFPELKTLFELTASNDPTTPTLMYLPSDVVGLEWVKYNKIASGETAPNFQPVKYVDLAEFVERMHMLKMTESNVGTFSLEPSTGDAIEFYYRNDKAPDYCTSFDDNSIIFDSFDAAIETTFLKRNKPLFYGLKEDSWDSSDSYIPKLDAQQFNILLKESKALAWEELRQQPNQTAAMQVRKAKIAAEKKKDRANYDHTGYYNTRYPNYGRK